MKEKDTTIINQKEPQFAFLCKNREETFFFAFFLDAFSRSSKM